MTDDLGSVRVELNCAMCNYLIGYMIKANVPKSEGHNEAKRLIKFFKSEKLFPTCLNCVRHDEIFDTGVV